MKTLSDLLAERNDPCWDSHEMVGMKMKNGKKVPNCVPKESVEEAKDFSKYIMKPTKTEPKIVRKTNPAGRTTDHVEYEVHGTLSSHKRTFKNKKEAEEYFNTVKEEAAIEEAVDKEHPIHKEYQALKKHDIKTLRGMIKQHHKIVDTSEFRTKEHAASHIIRARHGNSKVDKVFGFKEETVQEGVYKAELEGLPPTFMSGDSVSDVRARLRNLVKKPGEQIKDIQRVQPSQMKKYFRDMSTGKEEMEESYIAEAEMPDQPMDLSYLEESLADAYMMQFMAHQFHWNVKGQDFIQYHNFLEELYTEILEEVDGIAEQIRISGKAAPISLISLIEMSNIDEQETVVTTPQQMMTALEDANDEVILSLYGALDVATEANAQGLINFLADRIDAHAKIGWKLSSSQE